MSTKVGAGVPRVFFSVSIDAASVAAGTIAEQSFTSTTYPALARLKKLGSNGVVLVQKPTSDGVFLVSARYSITAGVVSLHLTFSNPSAGAINPVSQEFRIIGF